MSNTETFMPASDFMVLNAGFAATEAVPEADIPSREQVMAFISRKRAAGPSATMQLHRLVLVKEEFLEALKAGPEFAALPSFCAVRANGDIAVWPPFEKGKAPAVWVE